MNKDEAFRAMSKIMDALEKKMGRDKVQEAFEKAELKAIQNTLVYAVSDLAADVRSETKFGQPGSQFKKGPGGQLGLQDLTMSLETAEWWWKQNDAVQYTMARKVLGDTAKQLGMPFDRSRTIHAKSAKTWDSRFINDHTAKLLGSHARGIFRYTPFHQLSSNDQSIARNMYPHKSGGKYPFIDEHYYYPVDRVDNLYRGRGARRVLAIPRALIDDEAYMASLGYEIEPSWQTRTVHADEQVLSRFEEGKPADPTENMSPEDAEKWREMNEKHKDKFKTAREKVVARFQSSSRKPRTVPERHQLNILLDTVKNPLKGRFLGGPTAEEAEKILREEYEYTDAEIRRLKQAKTAGISYATDRMSVLFVEGRKPVPFNIDVIKEINHTTIDIIADDGQMHEAFLSVTDHQTSAPLTYQQEKLGMRRETRVDVSFPIDEEGDVDTSERATLAALAKVGKQFGFKVEPIRAGYRPQTRTAAEEAPLPEEEDWKPGEKRGE